MFIFKSLTYLLLRFWIRRGRKINYFIVSLIHYILFFFFFVSFSFVFFSFCLVYTLDKIQIDINFRIYIFYLIAESVVWSPHARARVHTTTYSSRQTFVCPFVHLLNYYIVGQKFLNYSKNRLLFIKVIGAVFFSYYK